MRARMGLLAVVVVVLVAGACGDDGGSDSAATTTTAADGATATTTTEVAADEGDGCLVGEWAADVADYTDGFAGYLERVGGPTLGGITGNLTLAMDGDRFVATFEEWTVNLVLPGGGGETTVVTNGDQAGAYTASGGTIAVTDLESTLDASGSIVVGGVETDLSAAPVDLDSFAQSNLFAEPMPYTCDDDRLELDVVVPELGEEFSTGLDRVA